MEPTGDDAGFLDVVGAEDGSGKGSVLVSAGGFVFDEDPFRNHAFVPEHGGDNLGIPGPGHEDMLCPGLAEDLPCPDRPFPVIPTEDNQHVHRLNFVIKDQYGRRKPQDNQSRYDTYSNKNGEYLNDSPL